MLFSPQSKRVKTAFFIFFLDHQVSPKPEKGSPLVDFRAANFSGLALPIPFRVLPNIGYCLGQSK